MDNTLQVLTEKLYNEGVEKGKEEAEKILTEAQAEANRIIDAATQKGTEIVNSARQKAADLETKTRSELQQASQHVVNALKQEVVSLIGGTLVTEAIREITRDKEYMQKLVLAAVTNWVGEKNLSVVVPESEQAELKAFLASKAGQLLDKGLHIESANHIKAGFQIGPVDGNYKVSFTETDFINFFKEFIRPQMVEMLFGQK